VTDSVIEFIPLRTSLDRVQLSHLFAPGEPGRNNAMFLYLRACSNSELMPTAEESSLIRSQGTPKDGKGRRKHVSFCISSIVDKFEFVLHF